MLSIFPPAFQFISSSWRTECQGEMFFSWMTFYLKNDVPDVSALPRAFSNTCESDSTIESDEKGGLFSLLTLCSSLLFIPCHDSCKPSINSAQSLFAKFSRNHHLVKLLFFCKIRLRGQFHFIKIKYHRSHILLTLLKLDR